MNTEITIRVPAEIAAHLAVDETDLSRKTLEALAVEGYRDGCLSIGQVAEMLDLSVLQAEEFLHSKDVSLNYSLDDFQEDAATIRRLNQK
jgi:predicted HTH domain antitoxin